MFKPLQLAFIAICACVFCSTPLYAAQSTAREKVLLDAGWRFHRGDFPGQAGSAITAWKWSPSTARTQAAVEADFPAGGAESTWQDALPALDAFHGRQGFAWFRTVLPESPGPGRT